MTKMTDHPIDTSVLHDDKAPVNTARCDTAPACPPGSDGPPRRRGDIPEGEAPKRIIRDGRIKIIRLQGPMGGEMRGFIDRKSGECRWIECACEEGKDGSQERPIPLATFLDLLDAAAFLGVKPATMYAWAPFLESADKRGSRLIFWTDALVNDDIPELENRLPHRADLESERLDRALSGEVLRRGRHATGCSKTHDGPCSGRPNPNSRRGHSRKWLRDLGKDRKK
jgi:hypothetical protein